MVSNEFDQADGGSQPGWGRPEAAVQAKTPESVGELEHVRRSVAFGVQQTRSNQSRMRTRSDRRSGQRWRAGEDDGIGEEKFLPREGGFSISKRTSVASLILPRFLHFPSVARGCAATLGKVSSALCSPRLLRLCAWPKTGLNHWLIFEKMAARADRKIADTKMGSEEWPRNGTKRVGGEVQSSWELKLWSDLVGFGRIWSGQALTRW